MAMGDQNWSASIRAERKERAWEMRKRGMTLRAIAKELDCSAQHVHDLITEEIRELKPAMEDVEAIRLQEDARLSSALEKAFMVLESDHVAHSRGEIVCGTDGRPLIDHGPTLNAVERIRSLSESRRKLWGIDAPEKQEHTHTQLPLPPGVADRLERAQRVMAEREVEMRDGSQNS